jgi:hypothetical protein
MGTQSFEARKKKTCSDARMHTKSYSVGAPVISKPNDFNMFSELRGNMTQDSDIHTLSYTLVGLVVSKPNVFNTFSELRENMPPSKSRIGDSDRDRDLFAA